MKLSLQDIFTIDGQEFRVHSISRQPSPESAVVVLTPVITIPRFQVGELIVNGAIIGLVESVVKPNLNSTPQYGVLLAHRDENGEILRSHQSWDEHECISLEDHMALMREAQNA